MGSPGYSKEATFRESTFQVLLTFLSLSPWPREADQEGYMFLTGRSKHMKRRGEEMSVGFLMRSFLGGSPLGLKKKYCADRLLMSTTIAIEYPLNSQ